MDPKQNGPKTKKDPEPFFKKSRLLFPIRFSPMRFPGGKKKERFAMNRSCGQYWDRTSDPYHVKVIL